MSHVPPQEYYASLPKHIAGAGAFFHDPDGKVLLVKPSYRDTWEIPGGGLEHGEHPFQAAAREVGEETGLELRPGRLLAVLHRRKSGELIEPGRRRLVLPRSD
jgi:8-oxo-dGTP pyrophosphatase MutT (NUDIX family)